MLGSMLSYNQVQWSHGRLLFSHLGDDHVTGSAWYVVCRLGPGSTEVGTFAVGWEDSVWPCRSQCKQPWDCGHPQDPQEACRALPRLQ